MSLEPLPPRLERAVANFAKKERISHDEAILKLLAAGLSQTDPRPSAKQTNSSRVVAEALRKVEGVVEARAEELAALSRRDKSVKGLIGFLKDEPDVVEAIRTANRERRQASYGTP